MKIMVCYDGSNVAKDALSLAQQHARAFNATVDVVTSRIKGTKYQVEEIITAENELEYVKEFFKNENIPCKTHLLIRGMSPGEDIVQFARENKTDEIIIGVRKRSKVEKILLGSTAQYVILMAPCPVLTVK
ncbi:MAG: universal stress protein [Desulfobacterales bacterium]|nr:universal stress protein [Desulfobacterales bacterium]MDD4073183.1 universal stress protein [Desulfobacterales bacterium]MDD4393638.1 universal stress protein [Desulfobacterales bacterium]